MIERGTPIKVVAVEGMRGRAQSENSRSQCFRQIKSNYANNLPWL
jgi:hypothetical protein